MFETLLKTLQAGLTLWDDKERNKYIDQLISLREGYYEEFNKDPASRDDSVLDDFEFRLRVLAVAFSSSVGKPNTPNQP